MFTSSYTIEKEGYKVGSMARDFNLKNVDGKMISMANYQHAQGFVIIFTCNHCPYSKMYEDRIIVLHNTYGPRGYPVIAINPNDAERQPMDSYEAMKIRAQKKGFPFPYLVDATQEISKTYGAKYTPHVFLLNKESNGYKVAYIGAIDDNYRDAAKARKKYVEDAIEELLAGSSVSTPFTKGIGCSIKWKED